MVVCKHVFQQTGLMAGTGCGNSCRTNVHRVLASVSPTSLPEGVEMALHPCEHKMTTMCHRLCHRPGIGRVGSVVHARWAVKHGPVLQTVDMIKYRTVSVESREFRLSCGMQLVIGCRSMACMWLRPHVAGLRSAYCNGTEPLLSQDLESCSYQNTIESDSRCIAHTNCWVPPRS